MFSKSKPTSNAAPVAPVRGANSSMGSTFSVFGSDIAVTGNVTASVDLHLDGRIEGDLTCANLVQGADSHIKGAVVAESAKLAGTIEGSINARDLIIHATARITGDVTYENLTIEQGSQVDGRFTHRRGGGTAAKPTLLDLGESKSA